MNVAQMVDDTFNVTLITAWDNDYHIQVHDRYVNEYNNSDNKSSIVKDFETRRSQYATHLNETTEKLAGTKDTLLDKLWRIQNSVERGEYAVNKSSLPKEYSSYPDADIIKRIMNGFERILDGILSGIRQGLIKSNELYELRDQYRLLLDVIPRLKEQSVWKPYFDVLKDTFIENNRCYQKSVHIHTLDYLKTKVIDADYPEKLKIHNRLSASEQGQIVRNKAAQEWVNRGNEISINYDEQIQKEVQELLKEKGEGWCITGSGNATNQFYQAVHRKLNPVNNSHETVNPPSVSTVRNRVNKLLKEGNL